MIVELTSVVGTQKIWKQERFIVHDTHYTARRFYTNLHGSAASPLAVYTGVGVYMDITDYIRTYPTVATLYFADDQDPTDITSISVSVVGLISPASVFIPYHYLEQYDALVIPPSRMYCLFDQHTDDVKAEFYATSGTWTVSGEGTIAANKRYVGQIYGAFTLSDGTHTQTIAPRPMQCGIDYALVEWVSFTGVTRRHWMEISKIKTDVADAYSLVPMDSEYITIKGRVDGFTIKMDGLSRYDLWYYADIITSSKVQVSIDGGTTFNRVQVTTNNITLPDGDAGDGKIEIGLNWKHYDAVAM